MPKVSFEFDCSDEQMAAMVTQLILLKPTQAITTPAIEPAAPVQVEEPAKPAKKEKKAKAEKVEAKTEEPAKVEAPAAKNDSAYTLDAIRGLIMGALQKIGSAAALQIVQDVAGVRKAADINPTKYAAVADALNKAVSEHDAIG